MPYTRLIRNIVYREYFRFFLASGFAIVLMVFALPISAQRVMQIETYGKAKTKKIFPGQIIQYHLKNQKKDWLTGTVEDYQLEDKLIVLNDRYVHIDSIAALRFDRKWPGAIGKQMFWFGVAWSAFAAVGTLTDGDPDSNYEWSDASVTGGFWLGSFLMPRLFRYRHYKIDTRHRLRMVDLQPFLSPPKN
ncbi:MAG: hypothetical protein HUU01_06995 [Saprospiraceae bacterium]|nr:hypothetical protein [Saprospiraceae bacterium]